MGSPPFLLSFCFVGLSWLLSFNTQKKKKKIYFLIFRYEGPWCVEVDAFIFFDNSVVGMGICVEVPTSWVRKLLAFKLMLSFVNLHSTRIQVFIAVGEFTLHAAVNSYMRCTGGWNWCEGLWREEGKVLSKWKLIIFWEWVK